MSVVRQNFSIVIPTYTGEDFIADCLDSILRQKDLNICDGVVVVIDGPNDSLREIVDSYVAKFTAKNILYKVIQFETNKGRLHARLAGASYVESSHVLFVDDRVVLTEGYINTILSRGEDVIMPMVEEANYPNVMSIAMARLRTAIFKTGKPIADDERYITPKNFDDLPKGTTSIWVPRKVFIEISKDVDRNSTDSRLVSDDTRILRALVEGGYSIYRDDKAKILYQPRGELLKEFQHTYKRGPLFIDYYLRTSSRYFYPLILFYSCFAILLLSIVLAWKIAVIIFAISIAAALVVSVVVAKKPSEIPRVFIGILLTCISFSAGLINGLTRKVLS